jgi:hypothetical protein
MVLRYFVAVLMLGTQQGGVRTTGGVHRRHRCIGGARRLEPTTHKTKEGPNPLGTPWIGHSCVLVDAS